ncbi:MAG TPA: DUF4097 family beta strand repeat-containing protein [Acidobacteriaceae bacterium]|jgi:DUF4097 and DUF4098 domain-containing protein YvlB|nr:DUF4097 family beta strand repeat-containing protein [Acidobacteriaceae bacterium]
MAAAPPPFTSGPSGPGNPDPRWQWKAQRRAAKDQWRAQRAYYRGMRRPSIVRPIVLIVIGIVALMIQTGTISGYDFWDWYVRWWPLLLIGLGLALLAEWYLQQGDPYGRRTSVGGLVFLIVLVALLGVVGKHAMNSPFGWHFPNEDDNNWRMHLFGQEHDSDRQFDQAFGANGKLTIDNPHGDVSISPSTDDRIHVSAHQMVWTSSERDADKQLTKLRPELEVNGNEATLKTTNLDRGSVDLTVQVPANTSISMKAGRGNVAVNGLNGTIGVDAGHGNVTLNKIGGACTAHMAGGDFSAHALTSTLSLSGRTEDANISDVSGRVTLDGDFLGDVNLSKLGAPVSFHSSRTTFEVDRLDGDLSLDDSDLTLENAKGRVQATTRSKNITLSRIAGPLDVETSDGDITVNLTGGEGAINLRNRNGAIRLGLPADHLFHVDARAHDGSVTSDLTYAGKVERSDHSLVGDTGSGGNGTQVTLVAEHGDIEVKRAETNTEATEAPEVPEAPEAPEGNVPQPPKPPRPPHLRVPKNQPVPQTTTQ